MKKILLIEDEPGHTELIKVSLKKEGIFELITNSQIKEAIEYLEHEQPDLVLSDWRLPDGRGIEILKHPRIVNNVPVVIMTSFGSQELAVEALKSGALDYLVKSPGMFSDLPHTINRALREWENIEGRRLAEDALLKSEAMLKQLYRNMMDVITMSDLQGNVINVSPSVEKILGFLPDVFVGKNVFHMIHPDDIQELSEKFSFLIENKGNAKAEFRIENYNGDYIWMETIGNYFHDHALDMKGVVLSSRDITDRKNAEGTIKKLNSELESLVASRTRQLEDALEKLKMENDERRLAQDELRIAQDELKKALDNEKELNEMKSSFISMISHEYRTPLTVILSSSYLLEEYFDSANKEKFSRHLGKIKNSVHGLNSVLDNIVALRKDDNLNGRINIENVEITKLVSDIIEEIKNLDEYKHEIILKSEPESITYRTDRKLFRNVLTNLLSNSIKLSRQSTLIKVTLSAGESDIVLTIADKGNGIDEKELQFLYKPFHELKNTRSISGSALGLSIVRKCLEEMNASIDIQDGVEYGTLTTIKFPVVK